MGKELNHISKLLSLVLRHQPEAIGLMLNENGWANVEELINKINARGTALDTAMLQVVVDTNDKKRFAFNDDKTLIRASQGHSISVDLDLKPAIPPGILYHGTADRFVDSILREGLKKQQRQYVHLSSSRDTAVAVGSRHGKPNVMIIDAKAMHESDFQFFLSENNVWLVDHVPVQFIAL